MRRMAIFAFSFVVVSIVLSQGVERLRPVEIPPAATVEVHEPTPQAAPALEKQRFPESLGLPSGVRSLPEPEPQPSPTPKPPEVTAPTQDKADSFLERVLDSPEKFRRLLGGLVTLLILPFSLWIVLSKSASAEAQKWATATLGTLLGYWLS